MKKNTEASLWNLTKGKTKTVIAYLESLRLPGEDSDALKYFEKVRAQALAATTANQMLTIIQYRPGRSPKAFDDAFEHSRKVRA